jgi:hypothetical protein
MEAVAGTQVQVTGMLMLVQISELSSLPLYSIL